MKSVLFICGVILGAIGTFAATLYLQKGNAPADQIVFSDKSFYDSRPGYNDGAVTVSGTLTGVDSRYANNSYVIACYHAYQACFVSYLEQVGPNQIGSLNLVAYPIVKWDAYVVVAQEESNTYSCVRTTITVERQTPNFLWVEEPTNQTQPNCKNSDTKVHKYTIEDSPGWKRIMGKK